MFVFVFFFFLCQKCGSPNCGDRRTETIWFHPVLGRTFKLTWLFILKLQVHYMIFSQFNWRSASQYHDASQPRFKTQIHRVLLALFPVCWSNHTTLSCSAGSKSDVNAIWNHQKLLREATSELRNKIIQNEWMLILLLTSRHIEWCCLHTQSCTAAQLK